MNGPFTLWASPPALFSDGVGNHCCLNGLECSFLIVSSVVDGRHSLLIKCGMLRSYRIGRRDA